MTDSISIISDAAGKKLFLLGNEAIARGAIEAEVQIVAAYPGTPSTEIAETLINLAPDLGIYAEWSVNEKVAFGVAMGAALCGVRALAVMKHVGVNVALDSIFTASYMGTRGGLVLVEAEAPGQWSSQDEQDNRYLAEETYLPMLEPSSVQEAKEMIKDAFALSEQFGHPFIIRSVTRLGHARSDVTLGEILKVKKIGNFRKDPDLVYLPAQARKGRRQMVARMAKIKQAVETLPYNHSRLIEGARLGIITSGISYSYLLEALAWLDLKDKISVLKIGTAFPLPENLIKSFLKSVPDILVVEENEPFLENHVRVIAQRSGLQSNIHGKDLVPLIGELSIRKVTEAVSKMTGVAAPIDFARIDEMVKDVESLLPFRPPSLCAGCPHRASHYAIKTACQEYQMETGIEPLKPGDIGCNALGAQAPLNNIDIASCMGGGFDLSNGFSRVSNVPVVAHLGDSTFFHSGIAPLINAVYNQAPITMIVLDNLTTAMTGSQPSPASMFNAHHEAVRIKPEDIARASGIKHVRVVDPFDLKKSIRTIKNAIKFKGPSLIVLRRPCAILDQREKKARGEKLIPYQVTQEKCLAKSPPACTAACPLHIDVRGYVKLVGQGNYDAALNLIRERLPFAGIMGRICTHPCETQCTRGEVEESISIAALKRTAADYGQGDDQDLKVEIENKEKVAIAGGGPAGLMAAYDLRRAGYQVTIFEALPVLGGMLSVGIPQYRLPREIAQNEFERILTMGIKVKLNMRVGRDIQLSDLKNDYEAVFIATGAHIGNKLDIKNNSCEGLVEGIDFLRNMALSQLVDVGKRAVIIGGGNVAIDCARSCLRIGFNQVKLVYRRDKKQMPALHEEIQAAEREGVEFVLLSNPTRIISRNNIAVAVECIRQRLGKRDSSGREKSIPIPGSEFIIDTDLIISATGEKPDLEFVKGSHLEIYVNGLLAADPLTLATNIPGIFAGGDVVTGPADVIKALAAGRKAAVSIERYFKGEPLHINREGEGPGQSLLTPKTEGADKKYRPGVITDESTKSGLGTGTEPGFSQEEAGQEAARCLACGCEVCIRDLGCPAMSVTNNEVTIDESQCPGCGLCTYVCPAEAIIKSN
jgi:indolepyruvate ferredoxin oxidoreductase alpha subunit